MGLYVLLAYAEIFYQWNVNEPANGLTHFRGFDNRHDSFTIANAVLDASGTSGAVSGRIGLQIGHTPQTYYLAEPSSPGAPGTGGTDASVWKFLQQANLGWRAPLGRGLLVEAGIFLSPIGPEGMPVKDQWSWSRSNLFFGLPFYHTGARISYPVSERLTLVLLGCNGWNSVVDNNAEKSVALEASYGIPELVSGHILYFGGVERATGAPEGQPWRHLLDAYVTWSPLPALTLNLHGDAGFEQNAFGMSSWIAGALSARLRALPWLYLAARADVFFEEVAEDAGGRAAPIFWPSPWVASQTATVDLRPDDHVSFRVEYRHDHAGDPMYFEGEAAAPNSRSQDTVTLGMTGWF